MGSSAREILAAVAKEYGWRSEPTSPNWSVLYTKGGKALAFRFDKSGRITKAAHSEWVESFRRQVREPYPATNRLDHALEIMYGPKYNLMADLGLEVK